MIYVKLFKISAIETRATFLVFLIFKQILTKKDYFKREIALIIKIEKNIFIAIAIFI